MKLTYVNLTEVIVITDTKYVGCLGSHLYGHVSGRGKDRSNALEAASRSIIKRKPKGILRPKAILFSCKIRKIEVVSIHVTGLQHFRLGFRIWAPTGAMSAPFRALH